jgi:hypothetical protein
MSLIWSVIDPCVLSLLHILCCVPLLPLSTSMLFSFSSCILHLCSIFILHFILYATTAFLFIAPLLYSFSASYYHLLRSCISSQKSHSLHVFITLIPLPDHPSNSLSQQLWLHLSSIYPLLCSACHIFAQFSPRSSSQLYHFTGGY